MAFPSGSQRTFGRSGTELNHITLLIPPLIDMRSVTEPGDTSLRRSVVFERGWISKAGHALGTSLPAHFRLDPELFDAHAVAALLTSEQNRRP